ncbi:TPM domain-containing protein [Sphingobacterium lactis]|uniref:TPM domain-containing protein n=1 Tax=Sphingobacterium lactis TaxID=797291 RepID=A0A1H5UNJ3_9SPHI|nr:TPM domain-containing protein [Sphingobacterium lactis]SEF76615.1 uncharacterized protein SAMN05421877_102357 [Sphingobacterium lactis]
MIRSLHSKLKNPLGVIFLVIGFFCSFPEVYAQTYYTVDNLPSPKVAGQNFYVTDPDHILSSGTVEELNAISTDIEAHTQAEFAIAIVRDYTGDDDFQFAFDLFREWGIGKKESNNGLLLFIAVDRREYRFISGYGMEAIFPDAYLKRIGEKYLVENFRNNDYDRGVLEASKFIQHILKSPDAHEELKRQMPEAIPFFSFENPILKNSLLVIGFFLLIYLYIHFSSKSLIKRKRSTNPIAPVFYGMGCMVLLMFITVFIFAFVFNNIHQVYQVKHLPYFLMVLGSVIIAMKITTNSASIFKSYTDEQERMAARKEFMKRNGILLLLAPIAIYEFFSLSNYLRKNKNRFVPPDDSGNWERMVRTTNKKETATYLSPGQVKEEKIGALKYEVWKDTRTGKFKYIPWDLNKDYTVCPSCGYTTLEIDVTKTLKRATYKSTGVGEKGDKCQNCSYYQFKEEFVIPKKTRSSSSSSSGGGGSSSSSGGGSFGGGSSGGGGAGGRW